MSVAQAAAEENLHTSPQTVRELIIKDQLDGYWQQVGKTFRFRVYQAGIDAFIEQHGRFPQARRRRRRPAESASARAADLQADVLRLQEALRRQSNALANMSVAFEKQEQALASMVAANSAQISAAGYFRAAIDELQEVAGGLGVPDFGPPS